MAPARLVNTRRLWLLAALAAVSFGLSLLGWEHRDDAWLLKVGGRPVDVRGAAWAVWQDAMRDCSAVHRLDTALAPAAAAAAAAAVEALRSFSPPDSRSARVRRLDHWPATAGAPALQHQAAPQPSWFLLQAEFDRLEPVVVLVAVVVRQEGPYAEVLAAGVWSGSTLPWNPAWRIRRFLSERVPQAPPELLACLDPLQVFAQPPKPL
jgi:hypothetical protein